MAKIMAHCFRCGAIFPSGLSIAGSGSGVIRSLYSRCPNCGFNAKVQDGYYEIIDGFITFFKTSGFEKDEFTAFKQKIETIIKEDKSVEDSIHSLQGSAPEITSLLSLLPKTRIEFYAVLEILLIVLGLFLNTCTREEQQKIDVYNVVKQYNYHISAPSITPPAKNVFKPPLHVKVGPYEPCPCGSGKKYKFCDCHKKKD